MRPALHPPVPSSTLLKFLKSQSENISFFSPNPRPGFTFDHAAPRGPLLRSCVAKSTPKSSARYLTTTTPRRATVEAGFLNLEFLFPRSAISTLHTKQAQPRSTPRIKKLEYQYQGTLLAQRSASTGSQKWHQKLWGMKSLKGARPLHPDDLPVTMYDGEDTSMFSLGRHISAKAAAQPKLRCTELDENGNVVLASGEFKKSELIAKVCHVARVLLNVMLI
jgi:magnesium transporter